MHTFVVTALTACLAACLAGALTLGGQDTTTQVPTELLAPDTEADVKFIVRSARKTDTKLILNSEKEWTATGNKCVVLPYDKHPKLKSLNIKAFGLKEWVVEAAGKPTEYRRDGKTYQQVEVTDPAKVRFKEAPRLQP